MRYNIPIFISRKLTGLAYMTSIKHVKQYVEESMPTVSIKQLQCTCCGFCSSNL